MAAKFAEISPEIKAQTSVILHKFISFCYRKITQGDTFKPNPAKEYLKKRGIYKDWMLKKFGIGYCPDGSEKEFVDILEKENLSKYISYVCVSEDKSPDRQYLFNRVGKFTLSNRVIFPVVTEEGIESIYGRDMSDLSPFRHKYSNPYYEGFFNLSEVKEKKYIIITEGVIDALTLISCGYHNTIGYCKGAYPYTMHIIDTSLFASALDKLKKIRTKNVYICFDYDPKTNPYGQRNAIALGSKLSDAGFDAKVMTLGAEESNDINELFLSIDAPLDKKETIFQEHIENAINDAGLWEEMYVRVSVDEMDIGKEDKEKILNMFSYVFKKVKHNP